MKDNYSTRKVKDLVNTQIEKYKVIASNNIEDKRDILTEAEKTSMEEDLQQYLLTLQENKPLEN